MYLFDAIYLVPSKCVALSRCEINTVMGRKGEREEEREEWGGKNEGIKGEREGGSKEGREEL